ncbi:hypothetical protein M441DRAFT_85805 [Trichoderma asperellum CBS 433.97]|uniref:Uncharacterized protein n=1 Tax=Trichoderma asperellum (strain ATCC 204424 / CBS 433.97 / NBRC 101777) TaxID=1042311 RepID=A0A2T3ZPT8_TRIA4|nr:hypothetical protein M441DRAFT_85805 [Trichoderma asperellum CBS 433.97]PTB46827.1 hypothetical protein M441DRAFT_85805 [Trichoderma asperellum CBS 433.97]
MVGLTRALALLAFGGTVQASPFSLNGTITQPVTLPTTIPPSTTASGNLTCGTIEVSVLQAVAVAAYSGLSREPALQCQCIGSVNSWLDATDAPTRTLTRTIGTGVTTFTETLSSTTTVVTTVLDLTSVITNTGNFIEPDTNLWYGSATSPCCYSCTIQASTVEVFYWTDATETPAVTAFSSNGILYESPSIYIGFSSLSAFDYCGLVGSAYANTTIAFDPTELSTLLFTGVVGTQDVVTAVTIRNTPDGSAVLNTKDLERNCSTISGYSYIPGNPSNAGFHITPPDPCHPTIVIPDRVRSLQPGWDACLSDAIGGFYDPPSALSPVSALIPTSSTPSQASTTPSPPRSTTPALPSSIPPPPPPQTSSPPPPKSSPTSLPPPPPPPKSSPPPPPPAQSSSVPPPPPPPPKSSSAPPPPIQSASSASPVSPPPVTPHSSAPASSVPNNSPSSLPASDTNSEGTNPPPATTAGRGTNGPQPSSSPASNPSSPGSSSDTPPPPPTGGDNNNAGGGSTETGGSSLNSTPSQTQDQDGGGTGSPSALQHAGKGSQPPSSVIVVGSATFSKNSKSEFVFGSTTLIPGGPPVSLGGTTLSLPTPGPSATAAVSGSSGAESSETGSNTTGTGSGAAGETVSSETGVPGSQETSATNAGSSDGEDFGSTNTASAGLPSTSVTTIPKSEAASGLFSAAMRSIKAVGVTMLVALYVQR